MPVGRNKVGNYSWSAEITKKKYVRMERDGDKLTKLTKINYVHHMCAFTIVITLDRQDVNWYISVGNVSIELQKVDENLWTHRSRVQNKNRPARMKSCNHWQFRCNQSLKSPISGDGISAATGEWATYLCRSSEDTEEITNSTYTILEWMILLIAIDTVL